MFSVNAKPVAVSPAMTTPSTIPVKSRRRKRKSSRTAAPLALSSTTGATKVAPQMSLCESLAVKVVASSSVAYSLARMATRVAAHAPQAKAKTALRSGVGSTRSSQRKAPPRIGTGRTARRRPTRKPSVPVWRRTSARMSTPHSASTEKSATSRNVRFSQKCRRGL